MEKDNGPDVTVCITLLDGSEEIGHEVSARVLTVLQSLPGVGDVDYAQDGRTGGHNFELRLADPGKFNPQAVFAVIGAERTRLAEICDRRVDDGSQRGKKSDNAR